MIKCSVCITPRHTENFENMHTAILGELKKRDIQGLEDTEELAKALSVLAADSLDLDIYQ